MSEVKTRFDFHIDDHFEWFQDDRYYAIVKDHDAPHLIAHGKSILLFDFSLRWDDGSLQDFQRLEMPKFLLEHDRPRLLSLAAIKRF